VKTLLLLLQNAAKTLPHMSSGLTCDLIKSLRHEVSCDSASWDTYIQALAVNLDHPNSDVAAAAEDALLAIGTLSACQAIMTRGSYSGRMDAARSLPRGCQEALEVILGLLQSMSWQVRETAVYALSLIAERGDLHLLNRLAGILEDPVREVRNAAVSAFRTMAEPDDPETIKTVSSHLENPAWPVQCATLSALTIVAPSSPELIESIAQRLMAGTPTFAKHMASRILKDAEKDAEKDTASSVQEQRHMIPTTLNVSSSRIEWGDIVDD